MKRRFVLAACAAAAVFSFGVAQASQYRDAPTPVGIKVSQPGTAGKVIESCLLVAAQAQRLPPAMLVILLNVEGGRLGRVSGNTNATVDIRPMQVNEIWLPDVARHWGVQRPNRLPGATGRLLRQHRGGCLDTPPWPGSECPRYPGRGSVGGSSGQHPDHRLDQHASPQ